jgi:hypothetical protein
MFVRSRDLGGGSHKRDSPEVKSEKGTWGRYVRQEVKTGKVIFDLSFWDDSLSSQRSVSIPINFNFLALTLEMTNFCLLEVYFFSNKLWYHFTTKERKKKKKPHGKEKHSLANLDRGSEAQAEHVGEPMRSWVRVIAHDRDSLVPVRGSPEKQYLRIAALGFQVSQEGDRSPQLSWGTESRGRTCCLLPYLESLLLISVIYLALFYREFEAPSNTISCEVFFSRSLNFHRCVS